MTRIIQLAKYVLVSDLTISHDYRDFPLLDFLPSAPTNLMPGRVYSMLKGKPPAAVDGGRASLATYPLRKIEASLLSRNGPEDVVVAHEDHIADYVDDETEVIGVTTMDPFGLGPLTMSYSVLFQTSAPPFVQTEFERLMRMINKARRGKRAKLLVGGPGVWELSLRQDALDRYGIDYAFQGEADDVAPDLFEYVAEESGERTPFYRGFQTFDSSFHKQWVGNDRFLSRYQFSKQFPTLDEIPDIVNPVIKGLSEVMRGCGIGCDFCEVTLRPIRYYPPEKVKREVEVNAKAGQRNAWLHSDEIFAYQHEHHFIPNEDALVELMSAVLSVPGIERTNPTHGRISIPAGYPDLMRRLSRVMRAGPENWIGIQVGVETGSDRLARMHMPNKTLPLKVGPDGSWKEIVWRGTYVMNKNYWRPAFTVQVGQAGEEPEDNWETVALINMMSNSTLDDGRPFEFTVTPMQNVPLGRIKDRDFSSVQLDKSQLAVYYASYRHLAKMASRNAFAEAKGNPLTRPMLAMSIRGGGRMMLASVSSICKKHGLDLEKTARHGLDQASLAAIPSIRVR